MFLYILDICLDLFLYVWGCSYRKRKLLRYTCYQILGRLNLMIVTPKTLMIKMDKIRLSSLIIDIMWFFYIKREYDTSSKAIQNLRRFIFRRSLEIHGCDFMMLMGLPLCTSKSLIQVAPMKVHMHQIRKCLHISICQTMAMEHWLLFLPRM